MWKRKRQREVPAVDTELVEIYDDLANVDEAIRLKAAHTLLTKFVSGGQAEGERLNGILRRLIKGLCSGRKAARLGFSVALTEFLTELLGPNRERVPGFQDVSGLITVLEDQTVVASGASGQEERDHQFGLIFGVQATIESGILYQEDVSVAVWNRLLDIIFNLAREKSWLREECGFVLYAAIQRLDIASPGSDYAQWIINRLHSNGLAKTPEGVAIWLAVRSKFPSVEFPKHVWHHNDPLATREKSKLAQILKETTATSSGQSENDNAASQRGHWKSKVHFAWQSILAQLLRQSSAPNPPSPKSIEFRDFWAECVDNNLFAAASSEERKFWGFSLLQQVIIEAPVNELRHVLLKNTMRCFMNQLASPDRYLHRVAQKARKAILERAESTPEAGHEFLGYLLSPPHGDVNFDSITKTKTIETLLTLTQREVVALYERLILWPDAQDEKTAIIKRQLAIEQLVSLVRTQLQASDENLPLGSCQTIISMVLSLFVKFAYFDSPAGEDQGDPAKPGISASTREMLRSRISSCLSHIMTKGSNPEDYACGLVDEIHKLEKNPSLHRPLVEMDEPVKEAVRKAQNTLKYICEKRTENIAATEQSFYSSAKLLISVTIVQVYNGDTDAVNILQELNDCYSKKKLKQYRENGLEDSTTLIEILLSLASQPSMLFRRIVQQVFTACASDINEASLQSMLKVLETKENLAGQAEIFDNDDEDFAASSSSSSASDVEELEMQDAPEADNDSLTSSASSSSTLSSPTSELAAFDAALATALKTRPRPTTANPNDSDSDSSSSSSTASSMSSTQMEALDAHLSTIFAARNQPHASSSSSTSNKKSQKQAREALQAFKLRVLDLLLIYLKTNPHNPRSLTLLLPLLRTIRLTHSPPVAKKCGDLIQSFAQHAKKPASSTDNNNNNQASNNPGPNTNTITATDALLLPLLRQIHTEAKTPSSNAHAGACSQASLLIVRMLFTGGNGDGKGEEGVARQIVGVYAETMVGVLEEGQGNGVRMGLFSDLVAWVGGVRGWGGKGR